MRESKRKRELAEFNIARCSLLADAADTLREAFWFSEQRLGTEDRVTKELGEALDHVASLFLDVREMIPAFSPMQAFPQIPAPQLILGALEAILAGF